MIVAVAQLSSGTGAAKLLRINSLHPRRDADRLTSRNSVLRTFQRIRLATADHSATRRADIVTIAVIDVL